MRTSPPRTPPRVLVVLLACLACCAVLSAQKHTPIHKKAVAAVKLGPGTYAVFTTNKGSFTAQLYPKQAPKAVANFLGLAQGTQPYKNPLTGTLSMAPLYQNLLFFRTVPGYMIQTGDLLNDGEGKLGYQIPFEQNKLTFDKAGVMALAQISGDPTSRGSQVFFTLMPVPQLNSGGYLIIGQIVEGLDVAKALSDGPRKGGQKDVPARPNVLRNVKIEVIK